MKEAEVKVVEVEVAAEEDEEDEEDEEGEEEEERGEAVERTCFGAAESFQL